jgi:hypothetical protein
MYAVWEDNTAGDDTSLNWEVRFRGVLYNGENTTDTKILSESIGEVADFPQIAASESNLYVVWSDLFIRTYPGMFDIFLTFSKDEGSCIYCMERYYNRKWRHIFQISLLSNNFVLTTLITST